MHSDSHQETRKEQGGPEIWRNYALHYARVIPAVPDWDQAEKHPRKFACRKPWLPDSREARLLDVGCGWGQLLLSLWCAGYRNLEGIDHSPSQVEKAEQFAAGRIPFACCDAFDFLPPVTDRYDVITVYDVLEHIPPDRALPFLSAVYHALAPGGRIVLRVPNMGCLIGPATHFMDLTHVAGYTETSLAQILDCAGFSHHVVVPDAELDLSLWRPWAPWRGFGLRCRVNRRLHRIVYFLSGKPTRSTAFSHNLEMYSHKLIP